MSGKCIRADLLQGHSYEESRAESSIASAGSRNHQRALGSAQLTTGLNPPEPRTLQSGLEVFMLQASEEG